MCPPGSQDPQWLHATKSPDFVTLWNQPMTSNATTLQKNMVGVIEEVMLIGVCCENKKPPMLAQQASDVTTACF